MGLLFIIVSCLEAYNISQVKEGTTKFIYFPDGFVAKRVIKIIMLVCIGILMYISNSIIKYMSFLCFLIAFTEIVVR